MDAYQIATLVEYGISIAITVTVFSLRTKMAARFPPLKREIALKVVGLAAVILFLSGTLNFANSFIGYRRRQLEEAVRISNAKLPRELPNGFLFERVSFEAPDVIVNYLNTRFQAGGYDSALFNKGLREARAAILGSEEIRRQVADGVVLAYRYYDRDHNKIGEFVVTKDDFLSSVKK
jgi:hypothetical protein